MDPHLLRTFMAVADLGSFSLAASRLGYTQSAVSQQIAALEADLGAVLLHRRPVTVTEAGARLLEHAGPILLRLDAARAEVARVAAPPPARLVLGLAPLAMTEVAVLALAGIRPSHPRLAVTLQVTGREAVGAAVAAGTLDLGLVDGAAAPGDPLRLDIGPATAVMVAERELAVVLPGGHPLAGRSALRLEDLADARWLDAPDTGMPLADLRAATGSDGFRPALRYEGTDVRTLIALASAEHGLTVLPRPVVDAAPGVTGVPLSWPPLVHRTEIIRGGSGGAAAAAIAAAITRA
ncbi:MAG TPA: LysR family transcriptional regulator [Streptosporangiaceae bacterium]|nr:LysR family transcriptional regulator [Streptosporangiaceae bacterium]